MKKKKYIKIKSLVTFKSMLKRNWKWNSRINREMKILGQIYKAISLYFESKHFYNLPVVNGAY